MSTKKDLVHIKTALRGIVLIIIACAVYSCSTNLVLSEPQLQPLLADADNLFEKGQYEKAFERLQSAGHTATRQDKKIIAIMLSGYGNRLLNIKQYGYSRDYYKSSLSIHEANRDMSWIINNHSYLGKIAADLGQYDQAMNHFTVVQRLQENTDDRAGKALTLNSLANIASIQGDYVRARDLLREAEELAVSSPDREIVARTRLSLASLYFNLRQYQLAINFLDRAMRSAESLRRNDFLIEGFKLRGAVYRQQGNYDSARNNYEKALELITGDTDRAHIYGLLGELEKEQGNHESALKMLDKALSFYSKSVDKLNYSITQTHKGEVRLQQKKYEQAAGLFLSAQKVFKDHGYRDGIGRTYLHLGHVYGQRQHWDKARESFKQAIDVYKALSDPEWLGLSYYGRGRYSHKQEDLENAERDYRLAIENLESVRSCIAGNEADQQRFRRANRRVYESLVDLLMEQGKGMDARALTESVQLHSLNRLVLEDPAPSESGVSLKPSSRYAQLINQINSISCELALEKRKEDSSNERVEYLGESLAVKKEELIPILEKLRSDKQYRRLYQSLEARPHELLESAEFFEEDFATLVYLVGELDSYAFLVSKNQNRAARLGLGEKRLSQKVNSYLALIRENRHKPVKKRQGSQLVVAPDFQELQKQSHHLYEILIAPLKINWENIETLAIIPFGPLNMLPFHALVKPDGNGNFLFLVEEKKIVYLWNTIFASKVFNKPNENPDRPYSIVAFADPDLKSEKFKLKFAREEVEAIKNIYRDTKIYQGPDANKLNFMNAWGKYNIVHTAVHTSLSGVRPSIRLAPPQSGDLYTNEIKVLSKKGNTHLVVLSGCETAAIAEGSDGNNLASIALSFFFAGSQVETVIATLWPIVDDAETSTLMREFYSNLKKGNGRYPAFHAAQLNMISRSDHFGQPFYWAPFVVYGNWN